MKEIRFLISLLLIILPFQHLKSEIIIMSKCDDNCEYGDDDDSNDIDDEYDSDDEYDGKHDNDCNYELI